jgi:hypothetical protein
MNKRWRCFHCDEVFIDETAAREHFGETLCADPACQIDMTDVRAMENQLRQYHEEDTVLHREIHALKADHAVALRREEEKGYARGLADGGSHETVVILRSLVAEIDSVGTRAFDLDEARDILAKFPEDTPA